jgi:hypothetical protein
MADSLQLLDKPPPGAYPYRFTEDDRHQYRVKVQPAGECLEFVVRSVDTQKVGAADYRAWAGMPRGKRLEPLTDRDRDDIVRRSTERAKRMVRLLSLQLGADRLLTFTTRDTIPLEQLQVVWDRFVRMARTFDSSFAYLAVPEPHKDRDHWHVHAAYKGWININVVRRMWHAAILSVSGRGARRDTAGARSPGNVDVQYRGRAHGIEKTRRIAGYIAKYITKDLVERFNKKRYWHTKGVSVPESQRRWLEADNLDDAVRETMRSYGLLIDDQFPVCRVWNPGNLAFFWVEAHQLEPPPF